MSYLLLTGATGLLGRYLMRDLTLAEVPLAVVVRPTRFESAAQRIETALARSESELGRSLVRPVVLEGDIGEPDLGFSPRNLAWVTANCSSVLHSAASLTFQADESTGEPWRSNVAGTRQVLSLCRRAGIRRYHHVSTAYVCGLRRGQILESELDVGQTLGNDYEQTKLLAETEAVNCPDFEQVTVYRPSIIVGDSESGFTTSYHGFYTPLRIACSLLQSVPWGTLVQGDFLGRLHLAGDETKNLVAVDWVSAVMTYLLTQPELHGQTYHLTNPAPATVLSMQNAIVEALFEIVQSRPAPKKSTAPSEDFVAAFREQMTIYQAYWSHDPQFDSSRTQQAASHLPCPRIDHDVMRRLIRFAVNANFGWPRETALVPPQDHSETFAPWLAASGVEGPGPGNDIVNIHASGPGGGQWNVQLHAGRLVGAGRGLAHEALATCYLTSPTLAALLSGELPLAEAIDAGRLVVVGSPFDPAKLAKLFRQLAASRATRILEKATIG